MSVDPKSASQGKANSAVASNNGNGSSQLMDEVDEAIKSYDKIVREISQYNEGLAENKADDQMVNKIEEYKGAVKEHVFQVNQKLLQGLTFDDNDVEMTEKPANDNEELLGNTLFEMELFMIGILDEIAAMLAASKPKPK